MIVNINDRVNNNVHYNKISKELIFNMQKMNKV